MLSHVYLFGEYTFIHIDDMKRATMGMVLVLTEIKVLSMGLIILVRKSVVKRLLNSLNQEYDVNGYKKQKKFYMTFSWLYVAFWYVPMVLVFIRCIASSIIQHDWIYPYEWQFPNFISNLGIFGHAMLYVWICSVSLFGTGFMIGFDLLFVGLIILISIEFDILTTKILKFGSIQLAQEKYLRNLIDHHLKNLEMIKLLEEIFSTQLLINFLFSSFISCFLAFNSVTSNEIADYYFNTSFCFSILYQFYVQCHFGQMLIDAGDKVYEGFRECKWENIENLKIKKALILITQSTQRSVVVTNLGFSRVSMHQFKSVLMRTYSYFTLCRQVYSKS
ncbi:putative odorant receptor 85d [Chironomus tepperi]|uniref:putative odorant receptor 85d n=1 Tax=Chironomus tepperi TaxID=113505 RepID=UPI00391F2370